MKRLLLILSTLVLSAQAMELPPREAKQLSLLELLPDELKVQIFQALTSVETEKKDVALAQAAKNIRALSVTSKTFAILAKDKILTGELIKELAQRYTDGDLVKAAIALGTDAASEWITSLENPYIQGAISDKLVEACKKGDIKVMQFLLKYLPKDRVDVEVDGKTPLMIAAQSGDEKVVDLLLVAGADVNAQDDKFKQTPLMQAVIGSGYPGALLVIERLLKAPLIDLKKKNWRGNTALQVAILFPRGDEYAIVNKLIGAGADVNTQNNDGQTPLMNLIHGVNISKTRELVDLLLFAGADPNIQDNEGTTALMIASNYSSQFLVQLLLSNNAAKAGIDKQDNRGQTALIIAARWGLYDIVDQLLEAGADPNLKDKNGATALWYLQESSRMAKASSPEKRAAIITLLKEYGAK